MQTVTTQGKGGSFLGTPARTKDGDAWAHEGTTAKAATGFEELTQAGVSVGFLMH
jgi:hypothetical protein